jgi:Enoyl-CoA hydratase/isomerase
MAGAISDNDIDFLSVDRFSAMGDAPVIIAEAAGFIPSSPAIQAVRIGLDAQGQLPAVDAGCFDIMLSTCPNAPAPWVSISTERFGAHVGKLCETARAWPFAATIMCRVLRVVQGMPFADALDVESFAYSALLGGEEFARWRSSPRPMNLPQNAMPLVITERDADLVTLTLNNPQSQNAMTAAMRNALYAALANVLDDPSEPQVVLQGAGKCFSTGGALGEFGTATDLAQAHIVRTMRSCALLLHLLGERASVRLHGACVGSGLEIPAAAARSVAKSNSWFQLPELRMGLIPGAGGTASVSRAIGRHRTAWLLLSGRRIDARLAHEWGLIHEIEE